MRSSALPLLRSIVGVSLLAACTARSNMLTGVDASATDDVAVTPDAPGQDAQPSDAVTPDAVTPLATEGPDSALADRARTGTGHNITRNR